MSSYTDAQLKAFLCSIPEMFQSEVQRATLSTFLWDDRDTKVLIKHLRLYDILRRICYVKTRKHPTPAKVMELMDFVASNPEIAACFDDLVSRAKFPEITDGGGEQVKALADKHDA